MTVQQQLQNRRLKIFITGGSSMIGRAIIDSLDKDNLVIYAPTHSECDLMEPIETFMTVNDFKPNIIIHCAGYNGNIDFNLRFPSDIYYRTVTMALNLYRAAAQSYRSNYRPMLVTGLLASCSYPDLEEGYFREYELNSGLPNYTVECHGLAKRVINDFGRQIYKQYGLPCQPLILTNSFGPYDSFHPDKTKVVGGMIRKFVDAKRSNLPEITFWGDGSPKREFLYSRDAGRIIAELVTYLYDIIHVKQYTLSWPLKPMNIGSGKELTIKETAEIIARIVGYDGKILWDKTKPNGQMRKALDVSSIKNGRDFVSKERPDGLLTGLTTFGAAIEATVAWYTSGKNKEIYDAKN